MSNLNTTGHSFLCPQGLWTNNNNTIWLGSTITLYRNLDKFVFSDKLTTDKRKQIIALLSPALLTHEQLNEVRILPAEELSPLEKEFLVEHFLSHQSFHQAHSGEAFIIDKSCTFLAVFNLHDHLILQLIDAKEELENSYENLLKIENKINQSANFAFSSKFGFLTSDVTQCGTGLVVNVFLHLPMLRYSNTLNQVLAKNMADGITQTGLQGNPQDIIGDIVAFHNSYTIGTTEENIFTNLRTLATHLVIEENSLRQQMQQSTETASAEIKDRVSRAYAILVHSYKLESVEALQALSLLKLGLDMNWLKGATQADLNKLLFFSRRAHLLCHHGQHIEHDKLPHRRAEFIHQALKGLELLI